MPDPLQELLMRREMEQQGHSDELIRQALALLPRQPTVPVDVVDPHDIAPYDKMTGPDKTYGGLGGFTSPKQDHIYMSKFSPAYTNKDIELLASILLHEQAHIDGKGEYDAYSQELDFLKGRNSKNKKRLASLEEQVRLNKSADKK